ncbi:hypothetical protein CIB48_g10828 [Xylaria polymorpha]|nr:hypothetical protein CIB48_g10828 [Xylaria polymorpha]
MSPITECDGIIRATHLAPELTPRDFPQEGEPVAFLLLITPSFILTKGFLCQPHHRTRALSTTSSQVMRVSSSRDHHRHTASAPPVGHSTPSPQSPPSSKGLWTKLGSLLKSLRGHARTPNNERQETLSRIKQVETELSLLRDLLATTKRADERDATWKLERETCTPAEIAQRLNERTQLGRVMDDTYQKLNTIAEVNFGSEWRHQATPRITVLEAKLRSLKRLDKAQQDLPGMQRRVEEMRVVAACPRLSGMSRSRAVRILNDYLQDQSTMFLKVSEAKGDIARLDAHLERMLTAYLR